MTTPTRCAAATAFRDKLFPQPIAVDVVEVDALPHRSLSTLMRVALDLEVSSVEPPEILAPQSEQCFMVGIISTLRVILCKSTDFWELCLSEILDVKNLVTYTSNYRPMLVTFTNPVTIYDNPYGHAEAVEFFAISFAFVVRVVPRTQFYAIEVARNREGLNENIVFSDDVSGAAESKS